MDLKRVVAWAAMVLVAACSSSGGSDVGDVGVFRMVNFTSETAEVRIGDRSFVLQPHEVSEPQTLHLDAGQMVVTPTSGAPITVQIPARHDAQILIAGARGHPPGSMPAQVSFLLEDTLPFPQIPVTYVATSAEGTNVDIYAALAAAPMGQAPVATIVNEGSFALEAGVWQIVVQRAGTNEVLYRNPAVQLNTREPVGFFLAPRIGAAGFEAVLVARNRTQVYPDVR